MSHGKILLVRFFTFIIFFILLNVLAFSVLLSYGFGTYIKEFYIVQHSVDETFICDAHSFFSRSSHPCNFDKYKEVERYNFLRDPFLLFVLSIIAILGIFDSSDFNIGFIFSFIFYILFFAFLLYPFLRRDMIEHKRFFLIKHWKKVLASCVSFLLLAFIVGLFIA
jgi:hypothetical protein